MKASEQNGPLHCVLRRFAFNLVLAVPFYPGRSLIAHAAESHRTPQLHLWNHETSHNTVIS